MTAVIRVATTTMPIDTTPMQIVSTGSPYMRRVLESTTGVTAVRVVDVVATDGTVLVRLSQVPLTDIEVTW